MQFGDFYGNIVKSYNIETRIWTSYESGFIVHQEGRVSGFILLILSYWEYKLPGQIAFSLCWRTLWFGLFSTGLVSPRWAVKVAIWFSGSLGDISFGAGV